MPWYVVRLTTDEVLNGKQIEFQDEFKAIFIAAGGPRDAALFGSDLTTGDKMYFSPGAVEIARSLLQRYGATECKVPTRDQVALLVGHRDAIKRLL